MAVNREQKRILVVIPTSTLTQRQLLEGLLLPGCSRTRAGELPVILLPLLREVAAMLLEIGNGGVMG